MGPRTLPGALQEPQGSSVSPSAARPPPLSPRPSLPSSSSPRCPPALAGPMTLQSSPSVLPRSRRQAAPLRLRAVLPLARQPARLRPRARSRPAPAPEGGQGEAVAALRHFGTSPCAPRAASSAQARTPLPLPARRHSERADWWGGGACLSVPGRGWRRGAPRGMLGVGVPSALHRPALRIARAVLGLGVLVPSPCDAGRGCGHSASQKAQREEPLPRGLGGAAWGYGGAGAVPLSAAAAPRSAPALLGAPGARPLARGLRGPEPALG